MQANDVAKDTNLDAKAPDTSHAVVQKGLPPGPTNLALVQAVQFGKAPFDFLEACAETYGETFTFQLPGDPPRVVFAGAAEIKEVFALSPDAYDSSLQSIPINLGETSMLFLDGERHKKERKLLMPPLHGERLRSFGDLMQSLTSDLVEQWKPGQAPVDVHPQMQDITLAVIVQCVFGVMDEARATQLKEQVVTWLEGTLSPAVFMASTLFSAVKVRRFLERKARESLLKKQYTRKRKLPWNRLADAKAMLCSLLQAEIDDVRNAAPGQRGDILAMLVETVDEAGQPLEDEHIIDELLTLLVGGHETTANSLCWALYHILQHPEAVEKIRAEVAEVCGGPHLDVAHVNQLKYLGACIDESMRLSPIAPAVGRNLIHETTIGGYTLPAGTIVWPCVYLAQRNKTMWPEDVTSFRPERFLEERFGASSFFPFGGGKRRCIGAAFAQYEMRIILAELLTRADVSLPDDFAANAVIRGITVVPEGGIPLQIHAVRRAEEM